jgi:folate-dependent tRNA-U54 methylase TrmFO/GidA
MPANRGTALQALSSQLSKTIPEGFFRLLAGRLMPVYVDCANKLEIAAGEAARLDLSEARAVVTEVVSSHPELVWAEEDPSTDIRVRAGKVFNHLLEAHW